MVTSRNFDLCQKVKVMVTRFPGVKEITKYRLQGFTIKGRLFLLCRPDSIIPTHLTPEECDKAYRQYEAVPFTFRRKERHVWPEITVQNSDELRAVEFLIHASMKRARLDD